MKISVIFGVLHMLFGVLLSYSNHTYFKKPLNIYCEFIPQVGFLVLLFVYMVLLMFLKWIIYWPTDAKRIGDAPWGPACAPSILITFINMILFKYDVKAAENCVTVYMFSWQPGLQKIFVLVAFVCIPWMLFAKPIQIMKTQKKEHDMYSSTNHVTGENGDVDGHQNSNNVSHSPAVKADGDEEENIGEIFIHQGIHTIEYVLGSVSHTASYLRLWALSLAHAQLSEVLWSMVLEKGLQSESWIGGVILWAIFAFWGVLTIGILVLMEGLSAFLHTLRLHWVEFQSKFYTGNGYIFAPFSFEIILATASATAED